MVRDMRLEQVHVTPSTAEDGIRIHELLSMFWVPPLIFFAYLEVPLLHLRDDNPDRIRLGLNFDAYIRTRGAGSCTTEHADH